MIRDAAPADLPCLRDIERRAAAAFAATPHAALAAPGDDELIPLAQLAAAARCGDLLVAEVAGAPVGFALLGTLGDDAHLREIDVLPEHAGAGIGAALLDGACGRAAARGAARIVLTTFRDVPFNAPWYARRGFVELAPESRGTHLDAILDAEAAAGLDGGARCAMARVLEPATAGGRGEQKA